MSQGVSASTATDLDDVRPSLGLLLTRLGHAVRVGLQPVLHEAGLMYEQWLILAVLADEPGLRMSEIGEAAAVPAASLTRHMDGLVERALVIRRVDPEDKRRAMCALSTRGTDMVDRIRVDEHSIEHALAQALGAERYAELTHQLALAVQLLH